jgi:L-threonylcarbamoyladenylate synthase
LFGKVSPTTALHVREAFPLLTLLDGGACQVGIESTILDINQGAPVLLRGSGDFMAAARADARERLGLPPPQGAVALSAGEALALEESVSRRWIAGEDELEHPDETTGLTPLLQHLSLA